MCDCTAEQHESIPDIHFTIDGVEYRINRDMWFERAEDVDKCVIKIMHGPHKPYWILGLNFFNNYYTVFDYKNMQIGFAESINMGKPPNKSFINWCLSSAGIYDDDYLARRNSQSSSDSVATKVDVLSFYIGLVGLVGIIGWLLAMYMCCKKEMQGSPMSSNNGPNDCKSERIALDRSNSSTAVFSTHDSENVPYKQL